MENTSNDFTEENDSKNENRKIKSDGDDSLSQGQTILKISKIREICHRTDISAVVKIGQILNVIELMKEIGKDDKVSSDKSSKRENEANIDDNRPSKKSKNCEDESAEDEAGQDDDTFLDSCVVCGLGLGVLAGNLYKEFHHYMSHGFRVLKEFDVMKRDDSLFLMCNICTSVYPKKCQGNFRKHLQDQHMEKIVEIFRCI